MISLLQKWGRRTKRRDIVRAVREEGQKQYALQLMLAIPDRIIRFDYRGHQIAFYAPDAHADLIQKWLLINRTFFEHANLDWVRNHLDLRGAFVVDAGANIGNHSIFFTKICEASHCVAFEPLPYSHSILVKNAGLNGLTALDPRRMALSDRKTELSVAASDLTNMGATMLREGGKDAIPAAPLDSLEFDKVDLLKIDVELMTSKVLAGAQETILQSKPPLMIEIDAKEADECLPVLARLNYKMVKSFGDSTYLYEPG